MVPTRPALVAIGAGPTAACYSDELEVDDTDRRRNHVDDESDEEVTVTFGASGDPTWFFKQQVEMPRQ